MLKKTGKDVFSNVKNQLTQSAKDKIQLSWKHFQDGKAVSNLTKADAIKFVWIGLLKDVGHKDLQQKVKHSILNLMQRSKLAYI